MERGAKTLRGLRPGQRGIILALQTKEPLKRRLAEMGLTPGTEILVRRLAPLGDPMELALRGYELSLRREDAGNILVAPLHKDAQEEKRSNGEAGMRKRHEISRCAGGKPKLRQDHAF